MSLREYCFPEAILCEIDTTDKEAALRELVDALAAAKAFPRTKAAAIWKEVVERERQATTGIGEGVAIPHARSAHAKKICIAIGRVPGGMDYGAVDGELVKVMLLLISPKESTDDHLAAMKKIVRIVRDPYQRARLHSCATPASFLDLFAEIGG